MNYYISISNYFNKTIKFCYSFVIICLSVDEFINYINIVDKNSSCIIIKFFTQLSECINGQKLWDFCVI